AVRAPEDSRFDPDRPQLVRFPAVQPSAVRPDQFHLLLDVLDVLHTNCASGGPRARRGPTFSFDELPDGLREPVGLGALLDQADRARGDGGVMVLSVQPNPAVLSHVDVAPREFREEGDHAPLFSDDPGTFVGEISITMPPLRRRASLSCIVSWTRLISSTLSTWPMMTSPT